MSERSLSIGSVVEPIAGGVIGLGLGYSIAPRKYSLKNLLAMDKNKLAEIYTQDIIHQMSPEERKVLDTIFAAKDEYISSGTKNKKATQQTAKKWQTEFRQIEIPQTLQNNLKETKDNLVAAIKQENYIALNKQFREAKKAADIAPDNQELQEALFKAKEALAVAKARLAGKIDNYQTSVRNIYNERLLAVKTTPSKWTNVKDAYKKFLGACARQRTILSNKLFELSNNKNLINCYNTIKEYIPKARAKSALTGGIIMGGMTSLIISRFNENIEQV